MSRSQESTAALKAIWMEGYNRGRRDERLSKAPVVEISWADIEATYEPGFCQHPGDCPCSALRAEPAKPAPQPSDLCGRCAVERQFHNGKNLDGTFAAHPFEEPKR